MSDITSAEFVVDGMTCQHCVRSVTEEVSALDGVDTVDVDLASGVVRVTGAVTGTAVREAIRGAGYGIAA